jgi:hypothetical protein
MTINRSARPTGDAEGLLYSAILAIEQGIVLDFHLNTNTLELFSREVT